MARPVINRVGSPLKLLIASAILTACAISAIAQPTLSQAHNSSSAKQPAASLELLVLGSGGPGAVGRAGSGFAVMIEGKARVLIDAGPGTFVRAGEEKLNLRNLDIVLLTHLHVDHAGGLPGLIKARAVSNGQPAALKVFGPAAAAPYPSTQTFIDLLFGAQGAFAYLTDFAAPLQFDVKNVATSKTVQVLLQENDLKISAIAGHHRDAPAVIYRVDYQGRSITFSGDIDPAGWDDLKTIAHGSDLLVFNSVVLDPPDSPEQLYALHTPPMAIGKLAQQAGVSQLLLTHLNPAIDSHREAVLTSIRASFAKPVVFAEDRLRLRF